MFLSRFALVRTGLAVAVVLTTLAASSPAVVIYSEPIQGDLPDDFVLPVPILPLVPGENELFGEILLPPPALPDPADALKFEVLVDQLLDEIIIELTAPSPTSIEVEIRELIDELITGPIRVYEIEAPTPGPVSLKDLTPVEGPPLDDLSGGIHGMRLKALDDPGYTVTFVVVPEPSTGLLLGIAGLTVLCLRRRRVAR